MALDEGALLRLNGVGTMARLAARLLALCLCAAADQLTPAEQQAKISVIGGSEQPEPLPSGDLRRSERLPGGFRKGRARLSGSAAPQQPEIPTEAQFESTSFRLGLTLGYGWSHQLCSGSCRGLPVGAWLPLALSSSWSSSRSARGDTKPHTLFT